MFIYNCNIVVFHQEDRHSILKCLTRFVKINQDAGEPHRDKIIFEMAAATNGFTGADLQVGFGFNVDVFLDGRRSGPNRLVPKLWSWYKGMYQFSWN